MKQQHAIIVLFALIVASCLTSFGCYSSTSQRVSEDMNQALALTMQEQQSDVISADTIRIFNSHLQLEALRGKAVLTVDTQKGFSPQPQVSTATIFSLSDQRPSMILWSMVLLWGFFCMYRYRQYVALGMYGGLALQEGRFVDAKGHVVRLTPMQQQLMEMLWMSPSHQLTKKEICDALWPKKPDANDTLYTLIKRLKPVIEQHSDLRIESDRGRAYELKAKN